MRMPVRRLLTVAAFAAGLALADTVVAQAPLGFSIDPTHGIPGNVVDGMVDPADVDANCITDLTEFTDRFALFVSDVFANGAPEGELFDRFFDGDDFVFENCDQAAYSMTGLIAFGPVFDPAIAADVLSQSFALTFADILTQEPQGDLSTFDPTTGLGSVVVPALAPGPWAVAAACVGPSFDLDLVEAGIRENGAFLESHDPPTCDINDPAFGAWIEEEFGFTDLFEFLFDIGPQFLGNIVEFDALGVQIFTIDQQCTDASECQDGDPCNGFETCDLDSTSGAFICQDGPAVTCTGVSARKLIILDKLERSGKATTVYVAEDGAVTKGLGEDTGNISARFDIVYDSASGAFVVPAGDNWQVNNANVAVYENPDAPGGETEAKVAVIKPTKLLKLLGQGLGDEPIDLIANGAPDGSVFTAFLVDNAGDLNEHCTEFPSCTFEEIAGGTGRKLVCKHGIPDSTCTGG